MFFYAFLIAVLGLIQTINAISLSQNFQAFPTSSQAPRSCISTYSTSITNCSASDFDSGSGTNFCTPGCVASLSVLQALLQEECEGVSVGSNTVLGAAMRGGLVGAVCLPPNGDGGEDGGEEGNEDGGEDEEVVPVPVPRSSSMRPPAATSSAPRPQPSNDDDDDNDEAASAPSTTRRQSTSASTSISFSSTIIETITVPPTSTSEPDAEETETTNNNNGNGNDNEEDEDDGNRVIIPGQGRMPGGGGSPFEPQFVYRSAAASVSAVGGWMVLCSALVVVSVVGV